MLIDKHEVSLIGREAMASMSDQSGFNTLMADSFRAFTRQIQLTWSHAVVIISLIPPSKTSPDGPDLR